MLLNILLGLIAAVLVALLTRALGRLAGISAAALFGAFMAFFTMDPALSFTVDNAQDRTMLVMYGVASLVVVQRAPRRKVTAFPSAESSRQQPAGDRLGLREILETAVARSGREGIRVDIETKLNLPNWSEPVRSDVTGAIESALAGVEATRITVYAAETPSAHRVWLALQYRPLPDQAHSLELGRRADLCDPMSTDLTDRCSVTTFDNGFEKVVQVAVGNSAAPNQAAALNQE
jgi:hypothetical protein